MSRVLVLTTCLAFAACGAEGDPDVTPVVSDSAEARPEVRSAVPGAEAVVAPDVVVRVVFSQPMQRDASARALAVSRGMELVRGSFAWDASGTVLAFRPNAPLEAGDYVLVVDEAAMGQGGAPLAAPFVSDFAVVVGDGAKL